MSNNSSSGHLNLAKFAFNIYGTLNTLNSPEGSSNAQSLPSSTSSTRSRLPLSSGRPDTLTFNCEKEVNTLTDLELSTGSTFNNNVVIGGKNYLKLLILNGDQTSIINEANLLESVSNTVSRLPGSNKLHNFNTIKSYKNTVAGGMVNGSVVLFQVLNNGKSRMIKKLSDHKRCINSLDFLDPQNGDSSSNLLISGSQDSSIKLWDLRVSNNKPSINIVPKSNYDSVRSCQFSNHSMARNKINILSVHDSGTLNKYDIRSVSQSLSQVVPERKWNFHTGPALSLNIHPTREYVITCGRDQKVCAWNYGENQAYNTSPEYVVHTYGPVMKVRWSPYANSQESVEFDDDISYDDFSRSSNPLFDYDFACLYLNEDPTITIYNLDRKYVPKEIVNSYSNRPYLNFIWAKNLHGKRRIWTLTKGNQFMSRCLDSPSEYDNITRPKDLLNPVTLDWGSSDGEMTFIGQHRSDFVNAETSKQNDIYPETFESEAETSLENDGDYNKVVIGSLQNSLLSSPQTSSFGTSPVESYIATRPGLFRSSTHGNMNVPQKITNSSPQLKSSLSSYNMHELPLKRPALHRNSSQTTVDSSLSVGSPLNRLDPSSDQRKMLLIHHASPYVIPVSLPLPLNDDVVFETLSNNYISTIPDGFSLVDVCLLNASVAASVNRFKDCQIWRIIATGLGQHMDGSLTRENVMDLEHEHEDVPTEPDDNNDNKSVLSDYGNINFGSYNSNSTLTTNYGGSEAMSDKKSHQPHSWNDARSSSTNNLMDMINQNRNNSYKASINLGQLSPNASRSNSVIAQLGNLRMSQQDNDSNEHAVEDDEDDKKASKPEESKESQPEQQHNNSSRSRSHSPEKSAAEPVLSKSRLEPRLSISPSKKYLHERLKYGSSPKTLAVLNRIKRESFVDNSQSIDLDNENLNVLNNAAGSSLSSSAFSGTPTAEHRSSIGSLPSNQIGSLKSRRSSIAPTYGFLNSRNYDNGLQEVEETTSNSSHRGVEAKQSVLTKAIEGDIRDASEMKIPWTISSLLEQALEHASLQGDVILCSVICLLFYPFTQSLNVKFIRKENCLEWLSLYIEILHKKRLFVNAMNILNTAPKDLQERLHEFYYGEQLRLYCQYCNELIVNEESKLKFKQAETNSFGYWYCEKCKKRQLNCIYCDEPCVGLNVVVSLSCGHRGHFGCLREWFVDGQNNECPGGCNETIL